jgi:hypothetical protein
LPPQFIYDTLDSPTDVWMFRQQFINQLAVVSFMNYVMHMANRLPHTIAFARNSGNVVLSDLYMSMLPGIAPAHLGGVVGSSTRCFTGGVWRRPWVVCKAFYWTSLSASRANPEPRLAQR